MSKKVSAALIFTAVFTIAAVGCSNTTQTTKTSTSNPIADSSITLDTSASSEAISSQEVTTPKIDWQTTLKSSKQFLMDSNQFPYIKDLKIQPDDTKHQITFTAVFADDTEPNKALEYTDSMLRQVAASAISGTNKLSLPSKDSYGGLYDYYSANIAIAPESQIENTKMWYVYDTLGQKVQTHHTFKLQKAYR